MQTGMYGSSGARDKMPEYAQVIDGVAYLLDAEAGHILVPASGPYPDRKIPFHSMWAFTEPELNAMGVYSIGDDVTVVPSDKQSNEREPFYEQPTNTVRWRPKLIDLPLADRKDDMREKLRETYNAKLWAGYSHDFGAGLGGVHMLDTSPETKSEWLDYRNACKELIDAGQGSSVMTLPIRTKANVDLAVRANQGMSAMQGMRSREGAHISHARALGDQIRAAQTHAALDAIDLNAGWPA